MLFKKTPKGPTPEEMAEQQEAERLAAQTVKIEAALDDEPLFQIMTKDGLCWICPFTGKTIKAPFGYREPALSYLLSERPWTKTPRKTLDQMRGVRWLHWLRQQVTEDDRLCYFSADGRWLNPFLGTWMRLQKPHRLIDDEALKDIAIALSQSLDSENRPLLPRAEIEMLTIRKSDEAGRNDIEVGSASKALVRRSSAELGSATANQSTAADHPDADLAKASQIITKMLAPLPTIGGYDLLMHYEPQDSVGGDFYESANLGDGRYFLAIGDVTGHGVQGAMVVVAALKSLRHVMKQTTDLVEVMARLSDDIRGDLLSGQFITVFAAILDSRQHRLTVVCAGHHAAIQIHGHGDTVLERFGKRGPAVGLVNGDMLRKALRPVTIDLKPGDTVIAYTDGLTEAQDEAGTEYGDWRAMGALLSATDQGLDEVIGRVIAEARTWAKGNLGDDLTLIGLRVKDEPEEPTLDISGD